MTDASQSTEMTANKSLGDLRTSAEGLRGLVQRLIRRGDAIRVAQTYNKGEGPLSDLQMQVRKKLSDFEQSESQTDLRDNTRDEMEIPRVEASAESRVNNAGNVAPSKDNERKTKGVRSTLGKCVQCLACGISLRTRKHR